MVKSYLTPIIGKTSFFQFTCTVHGKMVNKFKAILIIIAGIKFDILLFFFVLKVEDIISDKS
jgi:hypothetical protein